MDEVEMEVKNGHILNKTLFSMLLMKHPRSATSGCLEESQTFCYHRDFKEVQRKEPYHLFQCLYSK